MKYRIHIWRSILLKQEAYGLQAQKADGKPYLHCCATIDGVRRALIYTTRERAQEIVDAHHDGKEIDLSQGLVPLANQ